MCGPLRRCQPNKPSLPYYVLEDLEREIDDAKWLLQELRMQGKKEEAEQIREKLRFFWELHSEIKAKLTNIEQEENKT